MQIIMSLDALHQHLSVKRTNTTEYGLKLRVRESNGETRYDLWSSTEMVCMDEDSITLLESDSEKAVFMNTNAEKNTTFTLSLEEKTMSTVTIHP